MKLKQQGVNLRELVNQVDGGRVKPKVENIGPKGAIAFDKLALEHFMSYRKGRIKPRSFEIETNRVRKFARLFKDKPVHEFDLGALEEWRKEYQAKGRSNNSVNNHINVLCAIFWYATEHGYLRTNPAENFRRLAIPAGRERYLTEAEFGRLYAVADEVAKPWLLLALYSGMRPTELEDLKWDDIEFKTREFVVRASKTNKKRQIYIHDSAWAMVKEVGASTGSALLLRTWQDRKGRWKRPEKYIQKAFKAAKIADACYRDLRRTCATWLFEAGVEWAVIKLVLGHHMKDATAIYARTTQTLIRRAIEKLPDLSKITLVPEVGCL